MCVSVASGCASGENEYSAAARERSPAVAAVLGREAAAHPVKLAERSDRAPEVPTFFKGTLLARRPPALPPDPWNTMFWHGVLGWEGSMSERCRSRPGEPHDRVLQLVGRKILGQAAALEELLPCIQMYQAGLAPPGRPAGIFLLLGPTGTGKTRTVEALAEALHGSEHALLKVDCGAYHSDHEVAKLIGAPPGYIGHRETKPVLSQERLRAVTSSSCDLSLVLFDEFEKAAPALSTLLLGILDRGTLTLGDGTDVDFRQSMILLTSNLGARGMMRELRPSLGFRGQREVEAEDLTHRLEAIALTAVRKRFSPEFLNRIDAIVTYRPLDSSALASIVDQQLAELQDHVYARLGERSFELAVGPRARAFLLERGTSAEYGARELRRAIHRHLSRPLAVFVTSGKVTRESRVEVDLDPSSKVLAFTIGKARRRASQRPHRRPGVLVLDAQREVREWLGEVLEGSGFRPLLAASPDEARRITAREGVTLALIAPDVKDGQAAVSTVFVQRSLQKLRIVILADADMPADHAYLYRRQGFQLLRKPFLAKDVVELLHRQGPRPDARGRQAGAA